MDCEQAAHSTLLRAAMSMVELAAFGL